MQLIQILLPVFGNNGEELLRERYPAIRRSGLNATAAFMLLTDATGSPLCLADRWGVGCSRQSVILCSRCGLQWRNSEGEEAGAQGEEAGAL
jgi:hypothetical protein